MSSECPFPIERPILVRRGQFTLKYLQACVIPPYKSTPGFKTGDLVRVCFPEAHYLCKLTVRDGQDCVTVSDAVTRKKKDGERINDQFEIVKIEWNSEEIETLELDVVLEEERVQSMDQKQLLFMCRSICEMLVLCNGFDVDVRSYEMFKDWSILRLKNLATNTGEKPGIISPNTKITLRNIQYSQQYSSELVDLGGLEETRAIIEGEMRVNTRRNSSIGESNILLIGPSGCGKTAIIQSIAAALDANLFKLEKCSSSISGESALISRVERIIGLSRLSNRPSIVLIEDVEQFCGKATSDTRKMENNTGHELLRGLDLIRCSGNISVVCTSRNVEAISPKLRRPGRIGREVYIKVPNEEQRKDIVKKLLAAFQKTKADEGLVELIVKRTAAFLGGDLLSLMKTAQRCSSDSSITQADIERALLVVRPLSVRTNSYLIERDPSMSLDALGGLLQLKKHLQLAIFKPLAHPECFLRFNLSLPKGILLYGPPGCAKTTVAKCLANEMNRHLIAVSAAQIYSPFVGNSEQLLAQMFHMARACAPSIIFIDEIGEENNGLRLEYHLNFLFITDAIVGSRASNQKGGTDVQTKLLSTLLIEMDGVGLQVQANHNPENHILIIGATNRPDMIDDALMRPGRFDRLVYVPAPNEIERLEILRKITKSMPLARDVDLTVLSKETRRFSGADLVNLANEVALEAITRDRSAEELNMQNFLHTLGNLQPSLSATQLQWYEDYSRQVV